jgi:hypothetical protein
MSKLSGALLPIAHQKVKSNLEKITDTLQETGLFDIAIFSTGADCRLKGTSFYLIINKWHILSGSWVDDETGRAFSSLEDIMELIDDPDIQAGILFHLDILTRENI